MPDIKDVEIFSEGVWNGNKITSDVLQNIVQAFEKTKKFFKPVLKLGHNDQQKLLIEDGLPAAGWITDVRVKGKKLVADFSDIPDKIFELIKRKRYRKVSVEIFSGYHLDGADFPHMLGAVALLGSDLPACQNLNDILGTYGLKYSKETYAENSIQSHIYNYETQDIDMDELKDLKDALSAQQKQVKDLVESVNCFKKEKETVESDFEQYKVETEKKIKELVNDRDQSQIEKYSLSLKSMGLLPASLEPFVNCLLKAGKQDFSIGDKSYDTYGLIEAILKASKEIYSNVNFDEHTVDLKDPVSDADKALDEKIKKYAAENKVNYSQAYKMIVRK